eukprot:1158197-Pelagomonas_calceolata.AAC.3
MLACQLAKKEKCNAQATFTSNGNAHRPSAAITSWPTPSPYTQAKRSIPRLRPADTHMQRLPGSASHTARPHRSRSSLPPWAPTAGLLLLSPCDGHASHVCA